MERMQEIMDRLWLLNAVVNSTAELGDLSRRFVEAGAQMAEDVASLEPDSEESGFVATELSGALQRLEETKDLLESVIDCIVRTQGKGGGA